MVCVVDKACENERLQKEVERLYRKRLDWIGSKTLLILLVLIIVLYGVLLHMNYVHLNYEQN